MALLGTFRRSCFQCKRQSKQVLVETSSTRMIVSIAISIEEIEPVVTNKIGFDFG